MNSEDKRENGLSPSQPAADSPLVRGGHEAGLNRGGRERTPEIIAAEIRTFTSAMLNNIIEIGRRMVEAKAMLPYGTFGDWIREKTGYSTSTANNFMRLYEEYGAEQGSLFGAEVEDFQTFGKLSYTKALALLALPAGEREAFVETHDVEAMSTRELQEAIRERDEAQKKLREAKEQAEEDADTIACLEQQIEKLERRPVEVAVQQPDPAAVEQAVQKAVTAAEEKHKAELEKVQKKLETAEKARDKAKEAAEKAREQAESADKEELEKLRTEQQAASVEARKYKAEAEELRKKLAMSGEAVTRFKLHFKAWQDAYEAMQDTLCRMDMLPEAQETKEKLRAAVAAQVQAWEEN